LFSPSVGRLTFFHYARSSLPCWYCPLPRKVCHTIANNSGLSPNNFLISMAREIPHILSPPIIRSTSIVSPSLIASSVWPSYPIYVRSCFSCYHYSTRRFFSEVPHSTSFLLWSSTSFQRTLSFSLIFSEPCLTYLRSSIFTHFSPVLTFPYLYDA